MTSTTLEVWPLSDSNTCTDAGGRIGRWLTAAVVSAATLVALVGAPPAVGQDSMLACAT